jgi:hypothetical protein
MRTISTLVAVLATLLCHSTGAMATQKLLCKFQNGIVDTYEVDFSGAGDEVSESHTFRGALVTNTINRRTGVVTQSMEDQNTHRGTVVQGTCRDITGAPNKF